MSVNLLKLLFNKIAAIQCSKYLGVLCALKVAHGWQTLGLEQKEALIKSTYIPYPNPQFKLLGLIVYCLELKIVLGLLKHLTLVY
jgi:hypothetical protein